jgi:hypothetical protein
LELLVIVLKAKLTETRPLDVARDAWRDITRDSYRAVGQYWVDNMLQRHFEPGAAERYRYQFRSRAYRIRKDRAFAAGKPMSKGGAPVIAGSNQPNVLTGYMRREMSRSIVIRGFPTRATVIMYGPNYLTTRFYKKAQPDKPKELTTVTDGERRELAKVLEQEILNRLNAYRGQRVTE